MLRLIMQYKPSVSLYRHYNIQVPLVDSYTAIIIEPIAAIKLLIKILHYSIIDCMGRSTASASCLFSLMPVFTCPSAIHVLE